MNRNEALEAQYSDEFRVRITAAETLINFDDDDSSTALLRLLIDGENLAVTVRTAQLLMARNDTHGAMILFAGRSLAWAQTCDRINDVMREEHQYDRFDIQSRAREVLALSNPWSRFGARAALSWMGLELEE
jgi:hypothetical protein